MFFNAMDEPDKRDGHHTSDLEDTVRNLREENAKLLQLLRSQGLIVDSSLNPNTKSNESVPSSAQDATNITFDHSDLTLTTNTITTTNQINHQHIHNHAPTNQQNYSEQTILGNQSNIAPNFNTVIQATSQPFVQNNSNTLVQNNTNLIQPINLVNFNNVSLDSIQSFFASQNNVMYLSEASSSTSSSSTTTGTSATSIPTNCTSNDSTASLSSEQHPVSVRAKSSVNRQHQELVPVVQKIRTEHYESLTRQLAASSSTDTTNILDNDSNQKCPRLIRPKTSSRVNPLRICIPTVAKTSTSSSHILRPSSPFLNANIDSPAVSLFSSPTYSSSPSTTNYLSQSSSVENHIDRPPQLLHSNSLDLAVPATSNILAPSNTAANQPTKHRQRPRKKPSTSSSSSIISLGRPLAPASSTIQRSATSHNPIAKRSATTRKPTKRNIKTLVHSQSESILLSDPSSPSNIFAESISGLLENLDQELMAVNFLAQATTSNLLAEPNDVVHTLDSVEVRHLVNGAIQHDEPYTATTTSMPTLDEFNDRLESNNTHDFNVDAEQITSFMSEEDMRLVEMNFDENTFLKQFDLEDAGIKLSVHSDQNLFANILTDNNNSVNDPSVAQANVSVGSSSSAYAGSSLINNNVFTTVVPLGLQQQTSQTETFVNNNQINALLPQEGVQLTARHIEPSQVATYESAKYQDILDDLVMVTDQDALRHAQATAADDPSIVATDFSLALLEAAQGMIQTTNIQLTDQTATTFSEIPYFYSIDQQQQQPQQPDPRQKQADILPTQQPIVVLEKLQPEILASTIINKDLLETSILNASSVDLASILQLEATHSAAPASTTELITPIRPNQAVVNDDQPIDFDLLLAPYSAPDTFANNSVNCHTTVSDTSLLSLDTSQSKDNTSQCVLFEPVSSTSSSSSPSKTAHDEMIVDSGRLDQLTTNDSTLNTHDYVIEDLLRDHTIADPYEIVENQGQTCVQNPLIVDNIDQLIDQVEPRRTNSKLLERTFSRYQQKYHSSLQRQYNLQIQKCEEQPADVPLVTVKLDDVCTPRSPSPSPLERPPLKITIRAKLPSSVSSEEGTLNNNIRKAKKNKSHNHHAQKEKTVPTQPDTEFAGLTRFEQPLAQLYNQPSPPTSNEAHPKNETRTPSPVQMESQADTTTFHSGFIIDEQTPPSSITSFDHKQSPPPLLLSTQNRSDKSRDNYSHLLTYENNHEHQNNNAYITPPPEIDLNPHHRKSNSYETFCQFSSSPRRKNHQRHSRTTSSTSSKSTSNTEHALDGYALEPVSPTPLETSKQKDSSSTMTTYDDEPTTYYEHPQHKQTKDPHSKKSSSSSSNRSSRPTSSSASQTHQQSRSLSNHTHRTINESPLLPPVLPPPLPIHLGPYAPSYHHFHPRAGSASSPFFNYPYPHPFLNPHSTALPSHYHHPTMKYPHHHLSHAYPTPQQPYSHHPHLPRQKQYHNSNHKSSRDHHSFER